MPMTDSMFLATSAMKRYCLKNHYRSQNCRKQQPYGWLLSSVISHTTTWLVLTFLHFCVASYFAFDRLMCPAATCASHVHCLNLFPTWNLSRCMAFFHSRAASWGWEKRREEKKSDTAFLQLSLFSLLDFFHEHSSEKLESIDVLWTQRKNEQLWIKGPTNDKKRSQ